jgi:hypothetical protein
MLGVHSRIHIVEECPFYAVARDRLELKATRVCHQGLPIGKLLLPRYLEDFILFLSSGAF